MAAQVFIWSKHYAESYSAFAPNFKELEENEEYIEIHNTSDTPISLRGVSFTDGIRFDFAPDEMIPALGVIVLVDDEGTLLAKGTPQPGSGLPHIQQRKANFDIVRGGRYATEAEKLSHDSQ